MSAEMISKAFTVWNIELKKPEAKFAFGDLLSLGDLFLFDQYYSMH